MRCQSLASSPSDRVAESRAGWRNHERYSLPSSQPLPESQTIQSVPVIWDHATGPGYPLSPGRRSVAAPDGMVIRYFDEVRLVPSWSWTQLSIRPQGILSTGFTALTPAPPD